MSGLSSPGADDIPLYMSGAGIPPGINRWGAQKVSGRVGTWPFSSEGGAWNAGLNLPADKLKELTKQLEGIAKGGVDERSSRADSSGTLGHAVR
jgi:hypothetical protein